MSKIRYNRTVSSGSGKNVGFRIRIEKGTERTIIVDIFNITIQTVFMYVCMYGHHI